MENYKGLGLSIKMMFLTPNEVPIFLDLMKKYSENEAFNMILNGYKPQPFKTLLNEKLKP